nr:hypothetical protein [Tanacetum cinerariifolium]
MNGWLLEDDDKEEEDDEIEDDEIDVIMIRMMLREGSTAKTVSADNCRFSRPGSLGCNMKTLRSKVKTLDKQIYDRYTIESKMVKRINQSDLHMNAFDYDLSTMDSALTEHILNHSKMFRVRDHLPHQMHYQEIPYDPAIDPALMIRLDNPYVTTRYAATTSARDDGDDAAAPRDPQPDEGAIELYSWFERMKSVFDISECVERNKSLRVKYSNITAYTQSSNELVLLCPKAVLSEKKNVEAYIRGLPKNIKGETTSSKPVILNDAVRMAHTLMAQKFHCPTKCTKCGRMGHKANDCQSKTVATGANAQTIINCYECGKRGHRKTNFLKRNNQQGRNAQEGAYVIRDAEHNQWPNVAMGYHQLRIREEDIPSLHSRLDYLGITQEGAIISQIFKCDFWLESVQFLGHVIENKGVHVEPAKIEAIQNWSALTTPTKQNLCSAPILALPDGTEGFGVYCDSSLKGFGAVLMQWEKVIAYASQQLKTYKENYMTYELELGT